VDSVVVDPYTRIGSSIDVYTHPVSDPRPRINDSRIANSVTFNRCVERATCPGPCSREGIKPMRVMISDSVIKETVCHARRLRGREIRCDFLAVSSACISEGAT
jgi:hypothetical protein